VKFKNHLSVSSRFKREYKKFLEKIKPFNKDVSVSMLCEILSSIYYLPAGFRFVPGKTDFDIYSNGDILFFIGDDLLDIFKKDNFEVIYNSVFFKKLTDLYLKAYDLIKKINKTKINISYISSGLKTYFKNNIEIMGRKAGNEIAIYGGTKIELLYLLFFDQNSPEYKSFLLAMNNNIPKMFIRLNE